jgi:hypothetical protein
MTLLYKSPVLIRAARSTRFIWCPANDQSLYLCDNVLSRYWNIGDTCQLYLEIHDCRQEESVRVKQRGIFLHIDDTTDTDVSDVVFRVLRNLFPDKEEHVFWVVLRGYVSDHVIEVRKTMYLHRVAAELNRLYVLPTFAESEMVVDRTREMVDMVINIRRAVR